MSTITYFDTETTSNVPSTTRVVQVALLRSELVNGLAAGEPEVILNQLCNPGVQIHHEAQAVHGISAEMVKDAEQDSLVMSVAYSLMRAGHEEGGFISGHNVLTFDIPILFNRSGLPHIPFRVIDTLTLATRCLPNAPSHRLGELVKWLKLGDAEGAHDALADIRMCHLLVKKFCVDLDLNVEQLAAWCAVPRVLKVAHFGKHKGIPWGRGPGCVPFGYVKYITEKFEDTSPDMVATMRHHYGLEFAFNRRQGNWA